MRTVLVVDDQERSRDLLELELVEAGFSVETAADGDAGWKSFCSSGATVVLTDLQMPGCDGLELLVFQFLRDLGFGEDEVFRAIVYRPADGQHHMVTLWFESSDDPFVIDPTGAMTRGMPRMSDVPGWVPLKVFTETEEFTVAPQSTANTSRQR